MKANERQNLALRSSSASAPGQGRDLCANNTDLSVRVGSRAPTKRVPAYSFIDGKQLPSSCSSGRKRKRKRRVLSQATVSLKDVVRGQKSQKLSISMTDSNKRKTDCVLNVQLTYKPPPGAKGAGSGGGGGGGIVVTADDDDEDEDEQDVSAKDDEEGEEEDEEEAGDEMDGTPGEPGKKKKKKKKKKRGRMTGGRGKLSNKAQDFQIRVKVVEARQLPGANISPVARITCYNQTKQTRIKKSTNSPFFNEVFFFNYFCSPSELFDELITFSIFNSRKLRSDSLIGSFKCDIGMIYEEDRHSLLNKWLLLSDPDDQQAGAKGYLKISATILGPGDDAPSFKPATQADDDEDIESNLLRPAGVHLRPATFKLRVFRAEDIPRMDSDLMQGIKKVFGSDDKKELVDPYFVFSFAGQEVKSKIMYNNDHPEFNQELRLGLRFPSMCERIKLQMFDWDRVTDHDAVCTGYLNLREMSRYGFENGFLPTFGPCYINFYGSTREFTDLPDEYDDLNLGKGEGVAYRGRVLLSLETYLGEMPETNCDDLANEEVYKVQKYQRRRKFKLHVAFMNATMISAIDAPIEFEVSIGNYGNKLDESVTPCASTTQPTNAVFDGCYYYFLPWDDNKPCVSVDCHWEDISFRLEALNLISHIVERLEANIERVRVALKANLSTPELAQLMIALLDQLVLDCKKPLPEIIEGQHVQNDLDRQLRLYRESEMDFIRKDGTRLRESATDINETLGEVDSFLAQLKNLCVEPQNSIPDAIIWMISGQKRIAYFRAPANWVLWSSNPDYRGKYCGQLVTIQLKYPGNKSEKENHWEIPAQLQMKVFLGLEKADHEWHKMQKEGELAVYAETYENEVSILGSWTNRGPTMSRPKFSDITGHANLPREAFNPPPGWRWDSEWGISPERSMLYDKDTGHTTYLEDVYEAQARIPGGRWGMASVPYTDVKGDAEVAREETELPGGWEWQHDWDVDLNRAVDEEGWEYTVEATLGGYGPVEKTYHMCRRRRWLRLRKLVKTPEMKEEEAEHEESAVLGWEYAPLFNMKFHHKERRMDLVRRRRWHRKMVADDPRAPCFFQIEDGDSDSDDDEKRHGSLAAPRMFLNCTVKNKYQMRAYIYQARDLLAADSNGLSDPFTRVAFLNQSAVTEKLEATLCPTWDQTLIFETVEIHGDPRVIAQKPPEIVLELFDYDTFGSAEFLGRSIAHPIVKVDPSDMRMPVLQWYQIKKGPQDGGEMLAAFELLLINPEKLAEGIAPNELINGKDLPFLPPKRGSLYLVPNGIRPVMQRTAIEVVAWGVRNMRKFQLASVTSPSVELEVGGNVIQSKVIKNTNKNPNFDSPMLFFDIMLPREELYTPPMNIRVRDNRQFGRKPMVGIHVLRTLEPFRCDPLSEEGDDGIDMSGGMLGNGQQMPQGEHVLDMPNEQEPMLPLDGSSESGTGGGSGKPLLPMDDSLVFLTASAVSKLTTMSSVGSHSSHQKKKGKLSTFMPTIKMPKLGPFGKGKADGIASKKPDLCEDIDWWSKYYASVGELDKCKSYLEKGYDKIQVFDTELEKVGQYDDFSDFCHTFSLNRGKSIEEEESHTVGEFKGTFRVYPLPEDPNAPMPKRHLANLPASTPEECLVRIYIIKAFDLQPNDPSGLADPYCCIKLGKRKADNRDEYAPNTLNPVFGSMFEMKAILPMDKDLYLRVKDYDLIGSDDVIGETVIDLENRLLTKYRATAGLPITYCTMGPSEWRDSLKPKELLEAFTKQHNLSGPTYSGNNTVKVGSRVFHLADFEQNKPTHCNLGPAEERLSLHVLNTLPSSMGIPLVPEHVETRPLYNPLQPGIEQGKIQMWVDIFPTALGPAGPPIDIKARKPKKYQLRCVIWNTTDVILEEESITGEKMSDIYVKGWMSGMDDQQQETDVHYRSLDGEGNFNWRFVFPFEYVPAEESLVVRRKEHFWSLDETELHMAANLMIQIWDNDKFSADDFLGTLELNLNSMPYPTKKSSSCTLKQLPDVSQGRTDVKMVSIFEQKRVRGFWPCYSDETGERVLTGKVEMEIELLTGAESEEKPAGVGQDEPNAYPTLEPPKRPETSFLWFTSPWKTFKYIVWKNYKWIFIGGILIILLIIFLALFIYNVPGASVNKLING